MVSSFICVRILVYDGLYPCKVVYLRSGLNVDFVIRWRWFFEYLAALIKVHNPRRRVDLYIGPQDVKLGDEWKKFRTFNLLRHRKSLLDRLKSTIIQDDLFGFAKKDHLDKIESVKKDIQLLENGVFPIPDFPSYINEIKKWL